MRKDLITFKPVYSSFLSCGKDLQSILKTLFVTSKPYSDLLKRLLIINSKDCLDWENKDYQAVIDSISLKDMIDKGYIRKTPKITRGTHQEIKSYILISFDNFSSNFENPNFRQYNINFDIVCYNDAWQLDNYLIRPLMICGYIDGILNSLSNDNQTYQKGHKDQIKLSGVGEYQFLGCQMSVLNEDLSMYSLSYHGMQFTQNLEHIGNVHTK